MTVDVSETNLERLAGAAVAIYRHDIEDVTVKHLRHDPVRKLWKAIPDNITENNLPFDLSPEDRIIGRVRSVHAGVT